MLHLKKVFRPTSNPVITIIAAFSLLTLYGCGKEDLTDQSTAVPTEEINLRNEGDGIIDPSAALAILDDITYSSISVDASIGGLQFSDETTAAQTLNTLELLTIGKCLFIFDNAQSFSEISPYYPQENIDFGK